MVILFYRKTEESSAPPIFRNLPMANEQDGWIFLCIIISILCVALCIRPQDYEKSDCHISVQIRRS